MIYTDYTYEKEISNGTIINRWPNQIQVQYGREINGFPVIGPGDTIYLFIGDNGNITYCYKQWRKLCYQGEREIISAEVAYNKLLKGETIEGFFPGIKKIVYDIYNISIGYYSYSSLADHNQLYEPVWIFYCTNGNDAICAVDAKI